MRTRLTLSLPRIAFGALLVACAGVPIAYTRQTAEAFILPKLTLLLLCLVVAIAALAGWGIATRRWPLPRTSVRWPVLGLVGWTAVATAWSLSPTTSLLGQYGRYDGLLGVVAGVAVAAVVVATTWAAPERLRWVAAALVVSGVLGLAYVAVQQVGLDWVRWFTADGRPIERPYGLLGNSNFSGAHLALVVPLVLVLARQLDHRAARLGLWALAGGLGLGVWWTGTRGGMLALVGAVAAAGWLAPELVPRSLRAVVSVMTVAGVALVLVVSATGSLPIAGRAEPGAVLATQTLIDRQEIWRVGLRMGAERPLVGFGPDTFGLRFVDHRDQTPVDAVPINADEAHNLVVDRFATAGLPAVAFQLWLVGVVLAIAWRARRRVSPDEQWLVAGFGGAFVGYLFQGLVSIDVVPLAFLGWVSLGAVVALADPAVVAARTASTGPVRVRPLAPAALVALGVAALAAASLAVRPFIADRHYRDAKAASVRGDAITAVAELRAASGWLDAEPRYHADLAQQLTVLAQREASDPLVRASLLREAVLGYDEALALAPGEPGTLRAQAAVEARLADADPDRREQHLRAAEATYRGLVARVPDDRTLREEYGLLLEVRSRSAGGAEAADLRREATEQYRAALERFDRSLPALSGLARLADAEGRYGDALAWWDRAAALAPDDAGIATGRAETLERLDVEE